MKDCGGGGTRRELRQKASTDWYCLKRRWKKMGAMERRSIKNTEKQLPGEKECQS